MRQPAACLRFLGGRLQLSLLARTALFQVALGITPVPSVLRIVSYLMVKLNRTGGKGSEQRRLLATAYCFLP